jgi:hypothetical protein
VAKETAEVDGAAGLPAAAPVGRRGRQPSNGPLVAELGAAKLGPGDMGKVMAAAKARLAGKAEMGQVSAAVKLALAN